MASYFAITICLLDQRFHGRGDGGHPEWPPSPLRVFQALVAAAGARHRGKAFAASTDAALRWLEELSVESAPLIVAPPATTSRAGYRLSVPNNAMDIVASAWARGNDSSSGDADPRKHRTMKSVQPTVLTGGDTVHFLWRLVHEPTGTERQHMEALDRLAHSLVALGWGVDLVACTTGLVSQEAVDKLHGERWYPSLRGRGQWRVPVVGTLEGLVERHRRFLGRIESSGAFTAPPPLTAFSVIGYRRSNDPAERAVAAFATMDVRTGKYRSFDTIRRGLTLAGQVRHATHEAAMTARPGGWSDSQVAAFVLGHGEQKGSEHLPAGTRRFAYVPLPSIESRGARGERLGDIRRVLVFTYADDCEGEVRWIRHALAGQELIAEDTNAVTAELEAIPETESMVQRYLKAAAAWATVTPVVLPGYDDPRHLRKRLDQGPPAEEQKQLLSRLADRTDALIRKAIVQAGHPRDLAAHAEISWRKVGFWPGSDHADRYGVPGHLNRFPRYHVRIDWRDSGGRPVSVGGPLCIGGGRFVGLGLFAPLRASG